MEVFVSGTDGLYRQSSRYQALNLFFFYNLPKFSLHITTFFFYFFKSPFKDALGEEKAELEAIQLNNDIVVANYGQTIIAWSLKTKEMVSFFFTHQDFSLNLH